MIKENVIQGGISAIVAEPNLNGTMVDVQYSGATQTPDYAKSTKKVAMGEDRTYFYSCQDSAKLQNKNLKKVRDLQNANDEIQRQINQIVKDLNESVDELALLAEKERLQFVIARNTGEILQIYVENQERLDRIAELTTENERLYKESLRHRDAYVNAHNNMALRSQMGAEFFLAKARIKRNQEELDLLTQE